jgi:Rrf2 family transcriptional regulator, cysteine metabolism repressor
MTRSRAFLYTGDSNLKLTTRSEYALLALVYLGRQPAEEFVPVDTVARAQKIPEKYLEQILLALKRARCVRSSKGQHGGYQLAKPADKITLAEVIRLFDGALASTDSASRYFYEPTPIEKERKLVRVFKEIRNLVADRLEHTTIADMM